MTNTRAIACQLLLKVIQEGKSFDPDWIHAFPSLSSRDQSFVIHLCFGVLRHYFSLQAALSTYLPRPLKPKEGDLQLLALIGLYQLWCSDTSPHAALHETVAAVPPRKRWAKGLLNAVLRKAQTQKGHPLLEDLKKGHPLWLVEAFQKAWPEDWEAILKANQRHAPLTLRVNLTKTSREDYLKFLKAPAIPLSFSPAGIQLIDPVPIQQLPYFEKGWVSVQDEAAQLAASLIRLEPGLRILDACAAPGGKAAHLLETEKTITLWALEKDPHRKALLENTFDRIGLTPAVLLCADATDPAAWWDNNVFDRILLDVPCSATGIIRRHPDIKIHRQPEDIIKLTQQQACLLESLWPLLKPGGILLYATCSILPAENGDQIAHFLSTHSDAEEDKSEATWGVAQQHGRQILPGQHDMDGFYYARLHKMG